jgi:HAD superfamily hydrolase (TIGR01509 family)
MATFASHADYQREYDLSWIGLMCSHVGVPAPEESEARRIATAAADYITARAESAYPDAVSAIRMLAEAGFQLHTASGTRSFELENILNGMRLRDCFGQLSGPDLVDTMKAGPEYYRRVFARAGVESARAIVIDDSEQACGWAKETGAVAIRLDREGRSLGAEVAPDLATAARWLIDSFGGRTG